MFRAAALALLMMTATLAPTASTQAATPARVEPHAFQYNGFVMGVSRAQVYPFVDNWADTTVLSVAAPVPVSGLVQIINGAKQVFRTWPITTTQSWHFTWDGTDSSGHVLPYGQYWARAILDRDTGPTLTLDNRIQVLSEAIHHLTVNVGASTISGRAYYDVQGKGTMTIVCGNKVVYRKRLNWSVGWMIWWHGQSSSGHRLPAGKYVVKVTEIGHQGQAKSVSKAFVLKY